MPAEPAASATMRIAVELPARQLDVSDHASGPGAGSRASSANASVSSASPARIAMPFAVRRRAPWAGRAAACRCPSPGGRRARANRCESARARTPPGAPGSWPRQRPRRACVGDSLGGREHQHGPQPLAPGEDAVAHRLGHDGGRRAGCGRNRSSAASTARGARRATRRARAGAVTGLCRSRRAA